MSDVQMLMRELYEAHKNFKNEWRNWKNGKLSRKEKSTLNELEPKSVSLARDNFYEQLEKLYTNEIYPLEMKFSADPQSAVDEIIVFLSVDIPAFRCGYVKEFFLDKLKTVSLNSSQIEKLKQSAIELCEAYNFRREFRRWCRLMIKHADEDFVKKLENLSQSPNRYANIKSKWMLTMIFHHRKDFKKFNF